MMPSEAIEILKTQYDDCFECDGKKNNAIEMAISALKKQIPKTPGQYEFREMGKIVLPCPNCDSDLDGSEEYCKYCGQAIKWV